MQESRSARTDSKQYTLLTEVEKTNKHQGEKDTEQFTSSNSGVTTGNQRNVFDPTKVIRYGDTLVLQSDKESDKNSKRLGQPIEVVMISIERPIG